MPCVVFLAIRSALHPVAAFAVQLVWRVRCMPVAALTVIVAGGSAEGVCPDSRPAMFSIASAIGSVAFNTVPAVSGSMESVIVVLGSMGFSVIVATATIGSVRSIVLIWAMAFVIVGGPMTPAGIPDVGTVPSAIRFRFSASGVVLILAADGSDAVLHDAGAIAFLLDVHLHRAGGFDGAFAPSVQRFASAWLASLAI